MVVSRFKDLHTFEKRRNDCKNIREKYPDRIPCIVEMKPGSRLEPIDKTKFLVPNDLTISQFMYVLRKRIKIDDTKGLFLLVNDVMPASNQLMSQVYTHNLDIDGYLYFTISEENVFGYNTQ